MPFTSHVAFSYTCTCIYIDIVLYFFFELEFLEDLKLV